MVPPVSAPARAEHAAAACDGKIYVFGGWDGQTCLGDTEVYRTSSVSPGDFDGDGIDDIGVFRPATGLWSVRDLTRVYFGGTGDILATR